MNTPDMDFTSGAWEAIYEAVDDASFIDNDAELIYESLKHRIRIISFGDYLKRYIYKKAEMTVPFGEVPISEYQQIIKNAFSDNETPASFSPTTSKLSALSKNWLTQQTVKREVVFLLGFGLGMSVEDVNTFLTKGLNEREINPKSPFEVVCWYCYKNGFSFLKYEKLMELYSKLEVNSLDLKLVYSEETVALSTDMRLIHDNLALANYLSRLKANGEDSHMSATAKDFFDKLYVQGCEIIAKIYSESEEKHYSASDISPADFEKIICAAIPTDRHGNLTPAKASALNNQFQGRRFSRQRVSEILNNDAEVSRFDLITLNFFIYSQNLDRFENAKARYFAFMNSTNDMLEKSFLGRLYVQNPYECFVLMCILSEEPLSTYADVWELSYNEEK